MHRPIRGPQGTVGGVRCETRFTSRSERDRIGGLTVAAAQALLGHMNQITERVHRERQRGLPPRFADASRGLIPDPGFQPLVAFRIGYPSGIGGRRLSPRRPAAAVIL